MKRNLRELIRFYLIDCETIPGKLLDILLILLNVSVCVVLALDTYNLGDTFKLFSARYDIFIGIFFSVEFLFRLYGSEDRLRHLTSPYTIIDFLAILPTMLTLIIPEESFAMFTMIRMLKALRIFRFLRFFDTPQFFFGEISQHLLKVVRLLLITMTIFFVSAGMLHAVESSANAKIQTFGDAFYFTVVTLTTVGFGDITPVTEGGRWITVLMIFSGIVFIPWQASQIVKEWLKMSGGKSVTCTKCGLKYHDNDASHCKHCGAVIYQEVEG